MSVSGDMGELVEGMGGFYIQEKCETFARNRHSETGSHRVGPSNIQADQSLVEKYGSEPIPMEVFIYTHIKDHDGHTFVDRHVVGVSENYSTARKCVVSSQAGPVAERVASSRPQLDHSAEEISALRAQINRIDNLQS
ncbi:hypothetical protein JCGZ_15188 [Jatropha curcas]|uniref:Uncharacterized protein n=1 Tax=Jatropha curcas TaxID=180498 RepID=A0A067KG19_JATCU|nr:hypothetical protein JCGZ_15188 [Jatropha curcas]